MAKQKKRTISEVLGTFSDRINKRPATAGLFSFILDPVP